MNQIVTRQCTIDPEQLGYQTMRECRDLERAKIICGSLPGVSGNRSICLQHLEYAE